MNRTALFSLISFLVIIPLFGTRGAETKHNFGIWEKDMAAFAASDRTNPPPRGAVLFIGSSTIRMWKTLATDFPGTPVINRGFGGSEVVDSTHFADRIVFPYAPKMIFFRAGVNDIWGGKSPETVFADFKAFVEKVHSPLPETEIVFLAINPTPAHWAKHDQEQALNTMVKDYANQTPHLKYIETLDMTLGADGKPRLDFFIADHFHLNAAGYNLLAERVRPLMPK
jgi:lysophospholipase L1-like esterase